MVAGVASGIARHLGIDPVLVRLAFVLLALAGAAGVLAYLIAWVVIPEEDTERGLPPTPPPDGATLRLAAGATLVLLGLWWLLGLLVPTLGRVALPVVLIGIGIVIATAGARR